MIRFEHLYDFILVFIWLNWMKLQVYVYFWFTVNRQQFHGHVCSSWGPSSYFKALPYYPLGKVLHSQHPASPLLQSSCSSSYVSLSRSGRPPLRSSRQSLRPVTNHSTPDDNQNRTRLQTDRTHFCLKPYYIYIFLLDCSFICSRRFCETFYTCVSLTALYVNFFFFLKLNLCLHSFVYFANHLIGI